MTIENKPEDRLEDLGLVLPDPKPPLGAYVPYLERDGLVFISGQGPVLPAAVRFAAGWATGWTLKTGTRRATFGTEYSCQIARLSAATGKN